MDVLTTHVRFELAVRFVRQAWTDPEENYMHDASSWPRQEEMTRQVRSIQETPTKISDWNMTDERRAQMAEVLTKCSWYHHERGNFELVNRILGMPKSIAGAYLDPNSPLLSNIYFQEA